MRTKPWTESSQLEKGKNLLSLTLLQSVRILLSLVDQGHCDQLTYLQGNRTFRYGALVELRKKKNFFNGHKNEELQDESTCRRTLILGGSSQDGL
jgi:hypothetical protein